MIRVLSVTDRDGDPIITELEAAFVLHARPFRNTSLWVELLMGRLGRVAVIAKSARGPKSRYKGLLQPFTPLLVTCYGRGDLLALGQVELQARRPCLVRERLLAGFYVNELLLRLLHRHVPSSTLFDEYMQLLYALEVTEHLALTLRRFEKRFLEILGYGITWQEEGGGSRLRIEPDRYYTYEIGHGFTRLSVLPPAPLPVNVYCGDDLLLMARDAPPSAFSVRALRAAKHILRLTLVEYAGGRPFETSLLRAEV